MRDRSVDVLVVGGGVIGVCAAYYLVQRGLQVALLERDEIAAGCSSGNAGLIVGGFVIPIARPGVMTSSLKWLLNPEAPFYIRPRWDTDLLAWLWRFRSACSPAQMRRGMRALQSLGEASLALFDELHEEEPLDDGFQRTGVLLLYRTPQGFVEGVEDAHLMAAAGVAVEVIDTAGVLAREPSAREELAGGILLQRDGSLDPAAFVRSLAERAKAEGVWIHTGAEVISLEVTGRRVRTVHSAIGDFHPEEIVLAAGAWTPLLASGLGIRLPIQPAKGYSLTVRRPDWSPELPLLLEEDRVAVTPMRDTLRFAGTLELAGLNVSVNHRRVAAIRRAPGAYLRLDPQELGSGEVWAGLRPVTPDGLPIIGRAPALDNVLIAGGHAMLGMTFGPVTGALVSQLVCGDPPVVDLEPLRPDRF